MSRNRSKTATIFKGSKANRDSSHLSFLHRAFTEKKRGGGDPDMYGRDGAPRLEGVETDFGVRMISRRSAGNGIDLPARVQFRYALPRICADRGIEGKY